MVFDFGHQATKVEGCEGKAMLWLSSSAVLRAGVWRKGASLQPPAVVKLDIVMFSFIVVANAIFRELVSHFWCKFSYRATPASSAILYPNYVNNHTQISSHSAC
jgi:hypothetical protein